MDRPLSAWLYCRIHVPEDVYGVLKKQLRQSGVAVYSPLEKALSFSLQNTMQDVISYSSFQPRSEEDM